MTLALWQATYVPVEAGAAEALRQLEAEARQAHALGADLLICPEMSLTGYAIGAERAHALAETPEGKLAQAVAALAMRHQIAIVYGYPEQHPDGHAPFNAVQAFAASGQVLGRYRKTHLYGDMDHQQFSAGDAAPQVFTYRGWQLGLLICYDVEFPEPVRALALQGADAVLVPTANMLGFDEVPRLLVPARACENRVAVAYANACGQEGALHYGGLSTVVQADGTPLACAGRDRQTLLVTLAPSALAQARLSSPLPWRRPDLYGALTQSKPT
ncbi:carbon-nitrogen hydrolase family protein [Hydrogenophaga sp. PAMC20947]|nr:carbon-nitrogen hydrolase family protein [Hydrogenophaga sp. PAMC20947]